MAAFLDPVTGRRKLFYNFDRFFVVFLFIFALFDNIHRVVCGKQQISFEFREIPSQSMPKLAYA